MLKLDKIKVFPLQTIPSIISFLTMPFDFYFSLCQQLAVWQRLQAQRVHKTEVATQIT